jgi:hypothetical protein
VNIGFLNESNDFTDTGVSTMNIKTNGSDGYTVTAYSANNGQMKHETEDEYIIRWPQENTSPQPWANTCRLASLCGFGYTTSDNNLTGGTANRFGGGVNYAGFVGQAQSPGDPVASSATSTGAEGDNVTVTYKISAPWISLPGVYETTIYYVATVNY